MSKPREYYINDNAEGDETFTVSRTPWFGYIHVIEKSEYDKLELQNKMMKKTLEYIASDGVRGPIHDTNVEAARSVLIKIKELENG